MGSNIIKDSVWILFERSLCPRKLPEPTPSTELPRGQSKHQLSIEQISLLVGGFRACLCVSRGLLQVIRQLCPANLKGRIKYQCYFLPALQDIFKQLLLRPVQIVYLFVVLVQLLQLLFVLNRPPLPFVGLHRLHFELLNESLLLCLQLLLILL